MDSRSGNRMMNWCWFLAVNFCLVTMGLHGATGESMTLEALQSTKCPPGTQVCQHDGSCCNIADEICSDRVQTCVKPFKSGVNVQQKCCEILTSRARNATNPSIYNLCVFRYGRDKMLLGGACIDFPVCGPAQQLCVYDNKCCQRDHEVCSVESKKCQTVFWSDEDRSKTCCDVLRTNDSSREGLLSACQYLYGSMTWHETACGGSDGKGCAIVAVLFIGLVILFFLCLILAYQIPCVKEKTWCFLDTCREYFSSRGSYNTGEAKRNEDERDVWNFPEAKRNENDRDVWNVKDAGNERDAGDENCGAQAKLVGAEEQQQNTST